MSFPTGKLFAGTAVTAMACLGIMQPAIANPTSEPLPQFLLSQVNIPPEEGVPQLLTNRVQGRITSIDGDQVQVRLPNGELRVFTLSEGNQRRFGLAPGSDVTFTLRDETVIAVNDATVDDVGTGTVTGTTGTTGTTVQQQTTQTQIERQQTTTTTPAPLPQTTAQPAAQPQPIRALW